jgi:metal-dependent amidase/aminoacylase/carboxypeptidase family protein
MVTKGADAPNIVPAHTEARYIVRAPTVNDLEELVPRVHRCFEAGALHPLIGIESNGSSNHQPAFAAACVTGSADRAVIDGAIARAWTAIDAARDDSLRRRLTD